MQEKVWIIVKPYARAEKVEFINGIWNVQVKERAEEGAANSAVVRLLSKVWKKRIRITAGFKSRKKKIELF